jgi:hypothetical protein
MVQVADWVGGDGNLASNPEDWSPVGVPQNIPMLMTNGTMNIFGFDLGGTGGLSLAGNVTVNMADAEVRAGVFFPAGVHPEFNLFDDNTLWLTVQPPSLETASATVNLAAHARWVGAFDAEPGGSLVVNGGHFASFVASDVPPLQDGELLTQSGVFGVNGGQAVVNVGITGDGTIQDLDGLLEIGRSVNRSTMINVDHVHSFSPYSQGGILQIDHPGEFLGTVRLGDGVIDLNALARVDSYTSRTCRIYRSARSSLLRHTGGTWPECSKA